MEVREEQRRALFERLRAQLDEETATLMLEVTVPANVDLATRGDLQELRAEMLALFTRLDGRINGLEAKLEARTSAFEVKLDTKSNALEARINDVDAKVTALGTELLGKIYWVVIPVLATLTLAIVSVATWIGTLVG